MKASHLGGRFVALSGKVWIGSEVVGFASPDEQLNTGVAVRANEAGVIGSALVGEIRADRKREMVLKEFAIWKDSPKYPGGYRSFD
jgi:hypothetical protein